MKTRYQYLLGGTALGAAVAALAILLWPASPPAPLPPQPNDDAVEVVGGGGPPAGYGTGWHKDDDEVKAVAATLPVKLFADTPAGRNADPLPKAVYLWQAYTKLFARPPPPQNQGQVGSCVAFGTSRAIEMTLANEIVDGANFDWKPLVEEVIYGGSRVTIGGGRLRGDGSVGIWGAKYVTEYGDLPRGQYPNYDLAKYSESRCRQWGNSGPPAALLLEIKKYPVGATTQVESWQEAKKALAQKYGIAVCSNRGFTMQRDARGVCRPSGNWNHCMALLGYHTDEAGREYGYIQNSWDEEGTYSGPLGWGEPGGGGFWAESSVIDKMLKQGDSWAFSAVKGFPAKRLDWAAKPAPRNTLFAFWNK